MLVADLLARIRTLQEQARKPHEADTEVSRLLDTLERFEQRSTDLLFQRIATLSLPRLRKSQEQRERERAARMLAKASTKAATKLRLQRQQETADQKIASACVVELKSLIARVRSGSVAEADVNESLKKLDQLSTSQLFFIAQGLYVDAALTKKSQRSKFLNQITEVVRQVKKTSDNVNH